MEFIDVVDNNFNIDIIKNFHQLPEYRFFGIKRIIRLDEIPNLIHKVEEAKKCNFSNCVLVADNSIINQLNSIRKVNGKKRLTILIPISSVIKNVYLISTYKKIVDFAIMNQIQLKSCSLASSVYELRSYYEHFSILKSVFSVEDDIAKEMISNQNFLGDDNES
ncbi:MAG: hypothetical protein N3E37_00255 [Candidatus Micrarchaeota archaeon]|nr:hypothetical protein [Candidatus Micrarchaeota archaeon]